VDEVKLNRHVVVSGHRPTGNYDAALPSGPATSGETATPPYRARRCRDVQGTDEMAPAAFTCASSSTAAPTRGRTGRPKPGHDLDDADRDTPSTTPSVLTKTTRYIDK